MLRVAAAVIVVCFITAFYEYRRMTPAALYKENYQPYLIAQNRGISDSDSLESIFRSGRPADVIRAFRSLAAPGIQDYFLAGNAFLNAGDASHAIQAFLVLCQKNEQAHTHLLEEDTEYYLAMSYLENKQPVAALPLLEKIHRDPNHPYHDKVGSWWLQKVRWAH
jgi:hypothetical protein